MRSAALSAAVRSMFAISFAVNFFFQLMRQNHRVTEVIMLFA